MTTKPFSVLSDPLMADPESRRRIKLYKRAMEKSVTLSELRRSRGLSQRVVAHRLNQTQANISRLEREPDPHLSTIEEYVASLGGRLSIHATFEDQEIPLLIKH
jgi:transcriptional regulator